MFILPSHPCTHVSCSLLTGYAVRQAVTWEIGYAPGVSQQFLQNALTMTGLAPGPLQYLKG